MKVPLRSLLFAPGSEPRKLQKVSGFGADAVVADLEDAVADSKKLAAREHVRAAVDTSTASNFMVRINGPESDLWIDDLESVVSARLAGIVVPKIEHSDHLFDVAARLSVLEESMGLPAGGIVLIGLVETPLGMSRVDDLAQQAPRRTRTFALGSADLSTELDIELTVEGTELLYARSRLVMAVRAAGLEAPIDGPFLSIADGAGLLRNSQGARSLGFQGRVAIHPSQVEIVHAAFGAVSEEALTAARGIVEAFESAEAQGRASIRVDDRFVDYPIYQNARKLLDRASS